MDGDHCHSIGYSINIDLSLASTATSILESMTAISIVSMTFIITIIVMIFSLHIKLT